MLAASTTGGGIDLWLLLIFFRKSLATATITLWARGTGRRK